jgi:high-affinity Fe2+/Pb2+ permease
MHALVGYEPRPAGVQVASYALTVAVILAGMWLARRPAPSSL